MAATLALVLFAVVGGLIGDASGQACHPPGDKPTHPPYPTKTTTNDPLTCATTFPNFDFAEEPVEVIPGWQVTCEVEGACTVVQDAAVATTVFHRSDDDHFLLADNSNMTFSGEVGLCPADEGRFWVAQIAISALPDRFCLDHSLRWLDSTGAGVGSGEWSSRPLVGHAENQVALPRELSAQGGNFTFEAVIGRCPDGTQIYIDNVTLALSQPQPCAVQFRNEEFARGGADWNFLCLRGECDFIEDQALTDEVDGDPKVDDRLPATTDPNWFLLGDGAAAKMSQTITYCGSETNPFIWMRFDSRGQQKCRADVTMYEADGTTVIRTSTAVLSDDSDRTSNMAFFPEPILGGTGKFEITFSCDPGSSVAVQGLIIFGTG